MGLDLRIAIIGAGVIGRTHAAAISACEGVTLSGILDPVHKDLGVKHYRDIDVLIADRPDGVILATPNALHAPMGTSLLEAGIPVLIEKPLADTVEACHMLIAAATRSSTPALVGHQRRYSPIIRAAKAQIDSGAFGQLVAGSVLCSLYKAESYFDEYWRTVPGTGGPVLINLIHELDLLRHLFGEVSNVSAITSTAQRGLPVEDTAAAILEFSAGGLVTVCMSDAAVGPWAWDLTAGENRERFPVHLAVSHMFAGTLAGFSLPDFTWWSHLGAPDWTKKLAQKTLRPDDADVYIAQIEHFADVIHGNADPMVTLEDGLANLMLAEAIQHSASLNAATRIALSPPTALVERSLREGA
jgi:predicted dehydrogenase